MATSLQVWLSLGSLHFQIEGGYVFDFQSSFFDPFLIPYTVWAWYNEYEF